MLSNSCGVTTDIFKIKKANLVPITLKKISTTKAYNCIVRNSPREVFFSRRVLRKTCSENMQQIYKKTTYKMITSQYVVSQA